MSGKNKPTPKQVETLERMGIIPPQTMLACSAILVWIESGGERDSWRIDFIRNAQKEFTGKRVQNSIVRALSNMSSSMPS